MQIIANQEFLACDHWNWLIRWNFAFNCVVQGSFYGISLLLLSLRPDKAAGRSFRPKFVSLCSAERAKCSASVAARCCNRMYQVTLPTPTQVTARIKTEIDCYKVRSVFVSVFKWTAIEVERGNWKCVFWCALWVVDWLNCRKLTINCRMVWWEIGTDGESR
jgi:hypothetical protein